MSWKDCAGRRVVLVARSLAVHEPLHRAVYFDEGIRFVFVLLARCPFYIYNRWKISVAMYFPVLAPRLRSIIALNRRKIAIAMEFAVLIVLQTVFKHARG